MDKEAIDEYIQKLRAVSMKTRLTKRESEYKLRYPEKELPSVWRKPETIEGFLTKERLAELYNGPHDRNLMLFGMGLAIISDGNVFFLSDEGGYCQSVLPDSFQSTTMNGFQYEVGPGKRYPDVDMLLAIVCKAETHLNSLEALAEYCLCLLEPKHPLDIPIPN